MLIEKKDEKWQFCIYRLLNAVTLQVAYLLPWVDKSMDALAGS